MNGKVHDVAELLRKRGRQSLEVADRLEELVGSDVELERIHANGNRISTAGLERIRAASRAMWKTCPINCGVKHRANHPHITGQGTRKGPHMVAGKRKAA